MATGQEARKVLRRFRSQVYYAARDVKARFGATVLTEDATQEARILVLSYAGVMQGRLHGKLREWERVAGGDEPQVRALLGAQLNCDMRQLFGREAEKRGTAISLGEIAPGREPSYSPEDGWIARLDAERYVRTTYPYLAMLAYDEMGEDAIAAHTGRALRSVQRGLAAERASARQDPFFSSAGSAGARMPPGGAVSHAGGPVPGSRAERRGPPPGGAEGTPAGRLAA